MGLQGPTEQSANELGGKQQESVAALQVTLNRIERAVQSHMSATLPTSTSEAPH